MISKSDAMRESLQKHINRFAEGEIDERLLANELEALFRDNITASLNSAEQELLSDLSFLLDTYDPSKPPREGLTGKFFDFIESVLGTDRVSMEQIEDKARALRAEL